MKYTHLFFDADGTLFDFNTSEKKALEKLKAAFDRPEKTQKTSGPPS